MFMIVPEWTICLRRSISLCGRVRSLSCCGRSSSDNSFELSVMESTSSRLFQMEQLVSCRALRSRFNELLEGIVQFQAELIPFTEFIEFSIYSKLIGNAEGVQVDC